MSVPELSVDKSRPGFFIRARSCRRLIVAPTGCPLSANPRSANLADQPSLVPIVAVSSSRPFFSF